jgi:hypothetical protein
MSLIIITKSPDSNFFSLENYKKVLKFILNKQRGPSSVTASLIRGLKEINFDFKLNPTINQIQENDTLFINESVEALSWCLNSKKNYKIIAGPNLVVMPNDYNSIICNEKIDIILEPSKWVKNLITSIKPELSPKIKIWAAGVSIPQNNKKEKKYYLIYFKKTDDKKLIKKIKNEFKKNKINYKIIIYGKFNQQKYFKKLEESFGLIYIAKTESQCLALQEAWARNVPTMVLEDNLFKHKNINFKDEKMAAPYLNDKIGLFFNPDNFEEQFKYFISNLRHFTPRECVANNLSDKVCTEKFLDIIQ